MATPFCSTPIVRNKTAKRARVGSNTCPKCEKTVLENQSHIDCSVCELRYCTECTNISPRLAEALKEDTSHNFKWTCNGCKQNFPCMTNLSQQLKSIEETTNIRIKNVEDKVCKLDEQMDYKIQSNIELIKPKLIEDIGKDIKSTLQQDIRTEIREIEDQKTRTLNLVIFNLTESSSSVSKTRQSHDTSKFITLCGNLEIENIDINVTFRIGKPTEGKTRPLKVVLNNKRQRKNIIENAHLIKTFTKSNEFQKCIITKDLTPRQREENKQRRLERNKQKEKGGTLLNNTNFNNTTIPDQKEDDRTMQVDESSSKSLSGTQQPKSQYLLSPQKYYHGSQESLNSDDSVLNEDLGATIIGGLLTTDNRSINISEINIQKA